MISSYVYLAGSGLQSISVWLMSLTTKCEAGTAGMPGKGESGSFFLRVHILMGKNVIHNVTYTGHN